MIDLGGTDIGERIDGLAAALAAADGRLPADITHDAETIVGRASGRLKLSADHTVVALGGATGSGKSSTFNALTGLELAAVGVRRPTTSWATACVWGTAGARELLEWLGIPERHQTTRDSMLDTRRETTEMDGVVLLDLPDHDSTEVAHHLEVDRLVVLADLLIWVLDPQKYADAAIHDRYLQPLRTHSDVMVVVLNHLDEVPEERRAAMLDDVRRLLKADGLGDVPVLGLSAKLGWGVDELKAEIAERVAAKRSTRARLDDDIRATATRLEDVSGTARARSLAPERVEAVEFALAEAAGVATTVDALARSTVRQTRQATGWPPLVWLMGLGRGSGTRARRGGGERTTRVQRSRVDVEVRALADGVTEGLGTPWRRSVERVSVDRIGAVSDELDRRIADVGVGLGAVPWWASAIRVLQWLLLVAAVAGGGWCIGAAATGSFNDSVWPLVLLGGGLAGGVVVALLGWLVVSISAGRRARRLDDQLHDVVADVTAELIVEPISAELTAYAGVRAGLQRALG